MRYKSRNVTVDLPFFFNSDGSSVVHSDVDITIERRDESLTLEREELMMLVEEAPGWWFENVDTMQ